MHKPTEKPLKVALNASQFSVYMYSVYTVQVVSIALYRVGYEASGIECFGHSGLPPSVFTYVLIHFSLSRRKKLDEIKQRKLSELRAVGIPEKYCAEVSRRITAPPPSFIMSQRH